MIEKLRSLQNEVEKLLKENQKYRDSDSKLVAAFYYRLLGNTRLKNISGLDFLHLLAEQKIPFPDGITRVRRKLQENNPDLRGLSYRKRHKIESEFRKEIHTL